MTRARLSGAVVPHFSAACLAACTAWSTSAELERATSPVTSPVAGLVTGSLFASAGYHSFPAMKFWINCADICIFLSQINRLSMLIVERSTRVQDRF